MNVNKVLLVGRLTRDPEVRTTTSGQTVTSIGLATSHTWKDQGGQKQEKTEFHNLVLWGRLGEIAGQYLTKGQECYFEGRLQTDSFTGKDGVERRATKVIVENMQMGSRPQGQSGTYPRQAAPPASNAPNYSSGGATPAPKAAPKEEPIPTIQLEEDGDDIKIENVPF